MRDRKLDRLFDRYRRQGDVDALGAVFDGSAPELLRVAMSLVHDPVEADDLLQATYLSAIEKAGTWDSRRRLVPWLLGILVHHAHDLRRARARVVEPDRLHEREVTDPADHAERVEVSESLRRSIAALPARYRVVLQPFVEEGKRAAEIATQVGRAPGTVRMQIHRGLDLLRKALPAGLALGALIDTAGPGLAAVRERVLRRAATRAPLAGAGAALGSAWLGGWTVAQKAALATLALAVVGGLAWMSDRGAAADGTELAPPLEVVGLVPGAGPGEGSRPIGAPDGTAAEPGAAAGPAPERVAVPGREALFEASLSGLVGRLVEEDGSPVAGLAVELGELGYERLQSSAADVFADDPPSWAVARAVTGPDGSFRLEGARPDALHALLVDPGGERPAVRIVDQFLAPGEETDLGTIALPAAVPTRGRVVDAEGRPLAGVRVRAGTLNTDFEWERFARVDEDTLVLLKQNELLSLLVELPGPVRSLVPLVPFQRATTAADGTFSLPRAPRGALQLLVDHPEFLGRLVAAPAPSGGVREVGEVVLERGRPFQGRVVDGEGEPLPEAEVRAGAFFTTGFLGPTMALLAAHDTTDADGRFALSGVLEEGQVVFAARRGPGHPWVLERPKDPGFVVIDLPDLFDVTVRLVDEEGGAVDAAELAVSQPSLLSALEWGALLDARREYGEAVRLGPGHYELRGLQQGSYLVHGRAAGYAIAEAKVRVRARARDVELVFRRERSLAVRVLAQGSEEPLSRAAVSVVADRERTHELARAEAGPDGVARLAGLASELPAEAYLRVEHPRYATRNLPLQLAEGQDEVTVELDAGGALVLHLRHGQGPPPAPLMIELDLPLGAEYPNDYTKRFALADAAGDVSFTHLPPGRWRYRLFKRYFDGDVWGLISYSASTPVLYSGEVDVAAGDTAEVALDTSSLRLRLDLPSGTASIRGTATRDGEALAEATVEYVPMGQAAYEGGSVGVVDGAFHVGELPPGRYAVQLWMPTTYEILGLTSRTLVAAREVELAEGEEARADFAFESTGLDVTVLDAAGEPVEGAWVRIDRDEADLPQSATERTQGDGVAHFGLELPGHWRARARHPQLGLASGAAELTPGEGNALKLRLDEGVRCAGVVRVPEEVADEPTGFRREGNVTTFVNAVTLELRRDAGGEVWNQVQLDLSGGATEARFEVGGLPPGEWWATLLASRPVRPVRVVLPAGGRTDLTLTFELAE